MPEKFTIEKMFQGDDNDRQASLDQARLAAALTKPWILPRRGQRPNEEMPMNYQSVGSRGVSILAGKLLLAIYPAGVPWFVLVPAARLRNNPNVPPDAIQESQQDLFLYAQSLMAELESTDVSPDIDLRRRLLGFRSHKLRTLEQLLVTGDSLEMLDRQFRMHLFRRGSYVTKRDGSGAVLYHITKERIDVADLGQEKYQLSQLPPELLEEVFPRERIKDLYTWVRWQPEQRNWHIQQEVNGNLINESEEQISPYISTPYELTDDDYGRGFVEQNLGDIRSLDELELRRLDLLALAAKELIGKDPASLVRDDDLKQRPGSIVPGVRMINGVAQDIGPIGFANIRDFQMLTAGVLDKRQDLSKAMFIESESTRRAERVTTVEIQRNVEELQSALGGIYTSVADEQQLPLLQRLIHQFNLDHNLDLSRDENNDSLVEVRSLTGLSALANAQDAGKLLSALQILQAMGPDALQRIDMGVAVDVVLRQIGFHEPGLIKTAEQLQQEQMAADARALAFQGGQQAIQSTGKIAEQQAEPQPPPAEAA